MCLITSLLTFFTIVSSSPTLPSSSTPPAPAGPVTFVATRRASNHTILQRNAKRLQTLGLSMKGSAFETTNLTNINDLLFGAYVYFGSDQSFFLQLDTGSSDVWVRGPSCTDTGDGSCSGSSLSLSDSLISPYIENSANVPFQISYGSGSVSGNVYNGPVSLAGLSATIPFGVSTYESGDSSSDGLLGLAGNYISSIYSAVGVSASYFDGLGFTGSANRFAFYLNTNSDQATDALDTAEITLGGVDTSRYTGTITYFNVNVNVDSSHVLSWWIFSMSSSYTVKVGGSTPLASRSIVAGSTITNAISDTGTSLLILGSATANAINTAIGATYDSSSGLFTVPCSVLTSGPNITFTMGGTAFVLTPSIYVLNFGTCYSGITSGADGNFIIFGDIWLRQFYSIYDKSTSPPRVGFAQAVHGTVSGGGITIQNLINGGGSGTSTSSVSVSATTTTSSAAAATSSFKSSAISNASRGAAPLWTALLISLCTFILL